MRLKRLIKPPAQPVVLDWNSAGERFYDGAFEEADDCSDDGQDARHDGACGQRPHGCVESVFARFGQSDGHESDRAEQENRADHKAGGGHDLRDKSVFEDQGEYAADERQEKRERGHDIEVQDRSGSAKNFFLIAESKLCARVSDLFERDGDPSVIRAEMYCLKEHHAECDDAQNAGDRAGDEHHQ